LIVDVLIHNQQNNRNEFMIQLFCSFHNKTFYNVGTRFVVTVVKTYQW